MNLGILQDYCFNARNNGQDQAILWIAVADKTNPPCCLCGTVTNVWNDNNTLHIDVQTGSSNTGWTIDQLLDKFKKEKYDRQLPLVIKIGNRAWSDLWIPFGQSEASPMVIFGRDLV